MREWFRRALLSLSAYEFQRGFWFGGVLVLTSLFFSTPGVASSSDLLADFFALKRVVWAAIAALVFPLVFTLLSEATFWLIRKRGRRTYDPIGRCVRTSTERTESTQQTQGGSMTKKVREVSTKERYLVPVEAHSGGLKQIAARYWTKSFRSHFFGYSPYSVMIGPEREEGRITLLDKSTRGVVLATEEDALDFETVHKAFLLVHVCDGCWILLRKVPEDISDRL